MGCKHCTPGTLCPRCRATKARRAKIRRVIAAALGYCNACYTRRPVEGTKVCGACADRRDENRQRLRDQRRDEGLCVDCGVDADGFALCERCREKKHARWRRNRNLGVAA